MRKDSILHRVIDLYYDGFRSMRLGRTLWAIILIKLFIDSGYRSSLCSGVGWNRLRHVPGYLVQCRYRLGTCADGIRPYIQYGG